MTEFFIVPYPEDRQVFVDSGPGGSTNQLQSVERGSHTFDLGDPQDYSPASRFVFVGGTSFEHPLIVTFHPLVEVVSVAVVAELPELEGMVAPPRRKVRTTRKVRKSRKVRKTRKAGKTRPARKSRKAGKKKAKTTPARKAGRKKR